MLRPLQAEDWDNYLAMSLEFYASEATDHPVPVEHFRRTFDETVGGSGLARGWMTLAEGRPVGYCLASLTWSNEFGGKVAWLEELFLRPETRGQGLGRKVMESMIRELKTRDQVTGFRLEVAPANKSVSALYQKLGFSSVPYDQWWMAAEQFV